MRQIQIKDKKYQVKKYKDEWQLQRNVTEKIRGPKRNELAVCFINGD